MENSKVICKTDAEILLQFEPLEDSGFVFKYAKKDNGMWQHFVNCNGTTFGPYDSVYLSSNNGVAKWSGRKRNTEFEYENNGKDCKTGRILRIRKGRNEVLSQEEIDKLLTAIANDEDEKPVEYDESTHVLRIKRKKQEFFVTEKKKFGPYYSVNCPFYQNEDRFQFICKKRQNSNNWYYNCNGKEIGPFQGGYSPCYYDEQNRAVLEWLNNYNFILIDGKKEKCFREKYHNCNIYEKSGHKVIVGYDKNGQYHFKRDGIMSDFAVRGIRPLDNGDVVYSKIQDDTETWFYNDKQISVPIKGHSSDIYDSIITYRKNRSKKMSNIPYFKMEGKEYNGMSIKEYEEGFVYLDEGAIRFFSWDVPKPWDLDNPEVTDKYHRYRNGMFLRLYYTNKLAGRDS